MAMFILLFLLILFISFLVWYIQATRRPKNYPPGPEWLPIVGNLSTLKKLSAKTEGQHKSLWDLGKIYGSDIFPGSTLTTFSRSDLTVCVLGYRLVHHVLTHEEFEGRPDNFFIRLRCLGTRRGITCVDGTFWQEQRTFVVRHLRQLGYGKNTMEAMIQDEAFQILHFLEQQNHKEVQFEPLFAPSVLNVLWMLTTGEKFTREDTRLSRLLELLYTRSRAFDMAGGTLNQLPWLRHIIPDHIGYNLLLRINENLKQFFTQTIHDHYNSWYNDCQDDLIYSFITEMKKNTSDNFTDDQLIMICLDLFLAGATTTSNTLDFLFLKMLLYPDIQEKAVQKINNAIPSEKPITYADRLKIPYVEAIIMESSRMSGVAPVIGPRRVLRDTVLDGYFIQKNTTVLINVYSVHYDEEYWGDPHVFRPERFISKEGKLLPGERLYNFGLGRRRCLGELLARQCIFIFFTSILRKYKICPVPDTPTPSIIPMPGLTLSPQKYNVKLESRY